MEKREIKVILLSAAALCLAAAAFAGPVAATQAPAASPAVAAPTAPATPTATAAPTAATPPAAAIADHSDAEIIDLILAVDANEVAAATAAEKEKIGKEAMEYAKMLKKQHAKDSGKLTKLSKKIKIAPAACPASDELRAKGAKEIETLSGKDGADFEGAYIDAMVAGHTEALALFDEHLLKEADNEELKKQLSDTRKHIADHLEHGKRLQGARVSR